KLLAGRPTTGTSESRGRGAKPLRVLVGELGDLAARRTAHRPLIDRGQRRLAQAVLRERDDDDVRAVLHEAVAGNEGDPVRRVAVAALAVANDDAVIDQPRRDALRRVRESMQLDR